MPKQIALDDLIAAADVGKLINACLQGLSLKPPLTVAGVQTLAERDSNSNRWIVLKLHVKDERAKHLPPGPPPMRR